MADDLITIQLRLTGGTAAAAEARKVSGAVGGIGDTTATSMSKATKPTSKFRSTLSSLGRTMAYGAIPVVGALAYEVTKSVNAYREARKVGEQTNAVIKSTGGAAKVTAEEVARLSSNLSLKTGVDDEEIQAGANMLLTFKNIRNEVGKGNDIFNQATETINDMSSALGQDMKSSAIQLGKALNDPIAGITALSRVGVTFDQQTKDQITTLVEQGKTLQAQKIILRELTSEFGGSARAQHDSVDRLGVAWENLEEVLGKAVYPILQDVTQWLTKALRQASHGKGPLIDLKNWFGEVGEKIDWVASNVLDPFVDTLSFAYDKYKQWWDLTHQQVLPGVDFSGASDPFAGIAAGAGGNPQPGGGGQSHPGPQKTGTRPMTPLVAPPQRQRGAGKRALVIHNYIDLDGKRIGKNTTKHALAAQARA